MKNISIKVYGPSGLIVKEWSNIRFLGFSKEINAGLGECAFELLEKFDYGGGELMLGNTIDIVVADKDTTTTCKNGFKKIYSGYISMYEPMITNGKESITVHAMGHYTKLAQDILKSGSQTTMYTKATVGLTTVIGDLAAADAGHVLIAVLARYAAETVGAKLSAGYVPTAGKNIKYVFNQKTYRDAIEICKSAYASGYYWYIDEYGQFIIKAQDTTPKHIFILNKHIADIRVERSMEKIRNVVLIWDGAAGGNYKHYEDTDSINQYGRRVETINDPSIKDTATMDNIAAKFLAEHKDPDIRVTCKILDNNRAMVTDDSDYYGYDIEDIEPGETCRFMGFQEEFAAIFRDSLLITKVEYQTDYAILTIENFKSDIVDQTKQNEDQIDTLATNGIPATYT